MSYAVETAVVSWRWTALRGAGSENGEAAGLLDRPAWPARLADGPVTLPPRSGGSLQEIRVLK